MRIGLYIIQYTRKVCSILKLDKVYSFVHIYMKDIQINFLLLFPALENYSKLESADFFVIFKYWYRFQSLCFQSTYVNAVILKFAHSLLNCKDISG